MKNIICMIFTFLLLGSCNSHKNDAESTTEAEVVEEAFQYVDTITSYSPTETYTSDNTEKQDPANSRNSEDSQDYKNGYNSGRNMGYIAGQNNSEYNPYLPVGPNVRTHSYDYRCGYAAGYVAGYEDGQQSSYLGIH
ncbi:MAG: hypothetical protein HDS78_00415 [Bacteroidales bacterium]|nr:hypothetical protein [Bacteroidales bacterium]